MTQSNTDHDHSHRNHADDGHPPARSLVPNEIARSPIINTLLVPDKPDQDKEAIATATAASSSSPSSAYGSDTEEDTHQDTITSTTTTGTGNSASCCCDTTTNASTNNSSGATGEEFTKQVTKCTWTQIFAALSVSLADLLIGMSASYSAPAIASMSEENSTLRIPEHGEEASWIGSLMPLSALFGGILAGTLIELLGRKRTILSTALPLILAWLLIAMANHIWMLYIARVIAGLCVGIISLSLPVYIAETVQEDVRGRLGLLPTSFGNIGILICYTAGSFLDWRNLAFLGASLSVPFVICMLFVPDTPRWYISKGKDAKSEKSLQWFRGKNADIRYEMHQIKSNYNRSTKDSGSLKDLFRKKYVKPILVSLGLMFLQQCSGISAVIFYANTIFKLTGSSIENHTASIIVAGVNFGATFILIQLIDRYGRKILLLVSNTVMILSLGVLGGFFYMLTHHPASVADYGWVALACLMTFVVFFSLGFGPIPWLILGEIFPLRIRGPAAATATAFNWACTFLVTKTFPTIVYHLGAHTAFVGFAMILLAGTPFICCYVPETRGKSLEDIEKKVTRRISVISNSVILKAAGTTVTIVDRANSFTVVKV